MSSKAKIETMPVWFTHKRAFLLSGRCARQVAAIGALTPARSDLLAAIEHRALTQSELRYELGVCASVVSRMVTALVELGLVTREKSDSDRRFNYVTISDAGRAALAVVRRAMQRVLRSRTRLGTHRTHPSWESIQFGAELTMFSDWEARAKQENATFIPPSLRPQRDLLRYIQKRVAWTYYPLDHLFRDEAA